MPDENFHFYSKYINSLYEKYLNGRAIKDDHFKLYRAISEELGYDTQIKDVKMPDGYFFSCVKPDDRLAFPVNS